MTIVHAEVYTQAPDLSDPTANLGPVATEYQMAWEPSFWVTDASGTIVAEQHWAMSGDDMAAALAEATT